MTRWIAFDPETTSLLRSNLAQGTRVETLRRGPVDYALARAGAVITVLPAAQPASPTPPVPTAASTRPVAGRIGTRASGFLGLSDELFEEEEEVVEEKKAWWKRLWEE